MTTHRNHGPDTGSDRRGGLTGYLRAPADWSKGEVCMVTGIAAGATWLIFTHLLHAPTGVKAMLTGIVALLTFANCRQRHLRRHALTDHGPQRDTRSADEPADGLHEPGISRTNDADGDAPATVPDPRPQP
ncbi:hypothetical protein [Actinomadura kijaniata]|uniref:hypothetical protein n=1 Tax=Actinomadura kijaniata TaxID=46161 RepID=UPI0008320DED|nr:hypothetical protein [Actinomadura kijaniata]